MGHRALVAYEQSDGTYNVHYSHWGALDCKLAADPDALTEKHPFGEGDDTPEFVNAIVDALTETNPDAQVAGEATKDKDTPVDRDPRAVDVTLDEVGEQVTYDTECLYLVDTGFAVTPYVPKPIGDLGYMVIETTAEDYEMLYYDVYRKEDELDAEYKERLVADFGEWIPEWSPVR